MDRTRQRKLAARVRRQESLARKSEPIQESKPKIEQKKKNQDYSVAVKTDGIVRMKKSNNPKLVGSKGTTKVELKGRKKNG